MRAVDSCGISERYLLQKHNIYSNNERTMKKGGWGVTGDVWSAQRYLYGLLLVLLVTACSTGTTLQRNAVTQEPSYAEPPATSGVLAQMAESIVAQHGEDNSGFKILDVSYDALRWRLALIDTATTSLDIQTYLWYPDASGRLIMERAVLAAQRGVKVRMIVDDLIMQGHDQLIANLQDSPNIKFRLFNPWEDRGGMVQRLGEAVAELERLNTRMHDKLMIVDGRAVIVGGRNLGDHYYGLSDAYNFHDTDLLGIGPIAGQANEMFDSFWNSEWVVSAEFLSTSPNKETADQQWASLQAFNLSAPQLAKFPRKPKDWSEELRGLAGQLHFGRSKLIYDEASKEQIDQSVIARMFNFFRLAEQELLIMNAYVIPSQAGIDFMRELTDRGVDVRILTNSLASHDVPAVNSHYEPWRDDFLNADVALFELRSDPAIQQSVVEVPPVTAQFTGLHSKTAVVDRRYVFIGSMNLDPRSALINSEMGVFVDSPGLAEDMASIILRDMQPDNAWRVALDEDGTIYWENSDDRTTTQPARDGMQRVMNLLMKLGPSDQF
jgi:cardiolipin synthase C